MEKHSAEKQHQAVEKTLVKARKEVEINGNGTSGYTIREGEHAGTVLGHIQRSTPKI